MQQILANLKKTIFLENECLRSLNRDRAVIYTNSQQNVYIFKRLHISIFLFVLLDDTKFELQSDVNNEYFYFKEHKNQY